MLRDVTVELGLRERKKVQTRQLIADTARELFVERGFDRVSVAEIARTAEVSEATVFNYFRTKEDLIFSGLEQFETDMLDAIRRRERGEAALTAFARFILAPRGFLAESDDATAAARMSITRVIATSPALLAREQQIFAAYTDSLGRVLAEDTGARTKDLRPYVAANAMIGIHRALINYVRERILAGETDRRKLARDTAAVGRAAVTSLAGGFGTYARGAASRTSRLNSPMQTTGASEC
jgi:AcrR family transcriptional regulator